MITNQNRKCSQISSDICFVRLDFDEFSTRQPQADTTDADGDCLDTFTVSGAVGTTKNSNSIQVYPPILCGENAGQHMYLNAGRESSTAITLAFAFNTGSTFARKWNIKVTQLACDCPTIPHSPDCLQYFTGLQDTVKSFNFPGSGTTVSAIFSSLLKKRLNVFPFSFVSIITSTITTTKFVSGKVSNDAEYFTIQQMMPLALA